MLFDSISKNHQNQNKSSNMKLTGNQHNIKEPKNQK